MGLIGNIVGKKEEKNPGTVEKSSDVPEGKYNEACSMCGKLGTEKKWAGQYWHVKCIRKAKKAAKGML